MLIWVDSNEKVYDIGKSRKSFFEKAKANLSTNEFEAIKGYLNERIDEVVESGTRLIAPNHIVPSVWTETPLQIIFEKACPENFDQSALFLGLVFMQVMIERPELWYSTKTEFKGRDFEQMVYFMTKS